MVCLCGCLWCCAYAQLLCSRMVVTVRHPRPSYWPGQYGVWRLPESFRDKSSAGRWEGSQRHAREQEGNRGTHGFCGTGESGVPTHPRKDSRTEKRSSASKIETREASNDGPGLGNSQGKGHGPDRPDQSGSVGQDSKGIMHAGRSGLLRIRPRRYRPRY